MPNILYLWHKKEKREKYWEPGRWGGVTLTPPPSNLFLSRYVLIKMNDPGFAVNLSLVCDPKIMISTNDNLVEIAD